MTTQTKLEKQYFPHDLNARGDQNIVALMAEHGMAGYGLYWVIVEKLYEADGYLDANFKLLSYDLRVEAGLVQKVIEDFKLFKVKNGRFYSESVLRRLEIRRAKSTKASLAAHAKWDKEKGEQANDEFKTFWKAYPKQEGPDAALAAWLDKRPPLEKCLKALAWQKKLPKWNEDNGHWIPLPSSYIKAGRYNDIQHGFEEGECPECHHKGAVKKGFKGKIGCGKCGHKFDVS